MKISGRYLFCVTLVSKLTEQAIVKNLKGPMEDGYISLRHFTSDNPKTYWIKSQQITPNFFMNFRGFNVEGDNV